MVLTKGKGVVIVVAVAYALFAMPSFAKSLSVSPLLIDEETESRDIISEEITLSNETGSKLVLYATVNEIAVDGSGGIKEFIAPMDSDRTNTVTSWVEITRGRIELEPYATTSIPLTLRIHPQAKSGDYHVFIGFVPASKRFEAEAVALRGDAEGTIVKVSLQETRDELLRISGFFIDRFIVNKGSRSIDIEVENNGEDPTVPTGEVIFYNSLGEELQAIPVNTEGLEIPPGQRRTIKSEVPFSDELGRFKANVNLSYGNQKAAVFDTAQFFMVPAPLMIAILIGIVIFSVVVTYLIRRAFYDELHDDDASSDLPLYVRNDREHEEKDHDITLTKS